MECGPDVGLQPGEADSNPVITSRYGLVDDDGVPNRGTINAARERQWHRGVVRGLMSIRKWQPSQWMKSSRGHSAEARLGQHFGRGEHELSVGRDADGDARGAGVSWHQLPSDLLEVVRLGAVAVEHRREHHQLAT